MSPSPDFAFDPITKQNISENDSRFNAVNFYYHMLAIYQPEFDKIKNYYLNRTWHDYAVQLIQTAQSLGLRTKPPGFRAAPQPPMGHSVVIDPNYNVSIKEFVVCAVPEDPDPSKVTLKKDPTIYPDGHEEWLIVPISPDSGGAIANRTASTLAINDVINFLKQLSRTDLMNLMNQVLAG